MKRTLIILLLTITMPLMIRGQTKDQTQTKGLLLEDLTWVEAKEIFTSNPVVVIPLGAAAKGPSPYLKLKHDWLLAEYLKQRVLAQANVVMAPTINYNFYPGFLQYPGSTSLQFETARDVIVDICSSLASAGPRRFYIINTGIETLSTLESAGALLEAKGIIVRFTDISRIMEPV